MENLQNSTLQVETKVIKFVFFHSFVSNCFDAENMIQYAVSKWGMELDASGIGFKR